MSPFLLLSFRRRNWPLGSLIHKGFPEHIIRIKNRIGDPLAATSVLAIHGHQLQHWDIQEIVLFYCREKKHTV